LYEIAISTLTSTDFYFKIKPLGQGKATFFPHATVNMTSISTKDYWLNAVAAITTNSAKEVDVLIPRIAG
jgi:hypothetical protein